MHCRLECVRARERSLLTEPENAATLAERGDR
jgi:hypothetical protein